LTSRACPKYARTSPSSLPVNNAVNFMGWILTRPLGQKLSKSKRFPRPPRWGSNRSIRRSDERRYWVIGKVLRNRTMIPISHQSITSCRVWPNKTDLFEHDLLALQGGMRAAKDVS
jgi:hypothetical protein